MEDVTKIDETGKNEMIEKAMTALPIAHSFLVITFDQSGNSNVIAAINADQTTVALESLARVGASLCDAHDKFEQRAGRMIH